MTAVSGLDFDQKLFFASANDLRRIVPDLPASFSLTGMFHGNSQHRIIASLIIHLFHEVVSLQNNEPQRQILSQLAGDKGGWKVMEVDARSRGDVSQANEYMRRAEEVDRIIESILPPKDFLVSYDEIVEIASTLSIRGFRLKAPEIQTDPQLTLLERADRLLAQGFPFVRGGGGSLVHSKMRGPVTFFSYNWFDPNGNRRPLYGPQGILKGVITDTLWVTRNQIPPF